MFSHYSSFIPLVLVLFVWRTFVTLCVTVTNISMKSNDNMFISRLITYDYLSVKSGMCIMYKLHTQKVSFSLQNYDANR